MNYELNYPIDDFREIAIVNFVGTNVATNTTILAITRVSVDIFKTVSGIQARTVNAGEEIVALSVYNDNLHVRLTGGDKCCAALYGIK